MNKNKFIVTTFLLFISLNSSIAQWEQTNTPGGGDITALFAEGENLYAGAAYDGIYFSSNNGNNWYPSSSGLPSLELTKDRISSFAVNGIYLFAGSEWGGVFVSTDNGSNWTAVNSGLTNTSVHALLVRGSNIFAGTSKGVFISTNNGSSWEKSDTEISGERINSFAVIDTNIFVGTSNGIYRSSNDGVDWILVKSGSFYALKCLCVNEKTLFIEYLGGDCIEYTSDNGITWEIFGNSPPSVSSLIVNGKYLIAGSRDYTSGGIYVSSDNGNSWQRKNSGLNNLYIQTIVVKDSDIFVGTKCGVYRSSNNGEYWIDASFGLSKIAFANLITCGPNLLAGSYEKGTFISTNNGITWSALYSDSMKIDATCAVYGSNLYAGTVGGIYQSTDNGLSWNKIYTGFSNGLGPIFFNGTNFFALTSDGLQLSTNFGISWTTVNNSISYSYEIRSMTGNGVNLYFSARSVLKQNGGVYLSTDSGISWLNISSNLPNKDVISICINGINLLAGTTGAGVFLSTDNGANWNAVNNGLNNIYLDALSNFGSDIFAGTIDGHIFLSTNNGETWNLIGNQLTNIRPTTFAINDSNLFVATNKGIWKYPLEKILSNVNKKEKILPTAFELKQNYPNPFNPNSIIEYSIPFLTSVQIKIYDVLGKEIAVLVDEEKSRGNYSVKFECSNLTSGIYFYQLSSKNFVQTKKMIIMK